MTQPGNLKCKKILHLHLGQNDPVRIQKVVKDALLMCVTNSHTSVSFPAIGTGKIYQQHDIDIFPQTQLSVCEHVKNFIRVVLLSSFC